MPGSNPPYDDQFMYAPPPHRIRFLAALVISLAFILILAVCAGFLLLFVHLPRGSGVYACTDCSTPPTLKGVSMVSAGDGWVVGDMGNQGTILHYQNGVWMSLHLPTGTPPLSSVFMLSASDGWIVGDSGTILHYTSGHWVSVASPTHYRLSSVFMLSPMDGWAGGPDGAVLHYNGASWEIVTAIPGLRSVFMASPSEGWAVGADVIAHGHNGVWTMLDLSALPSSMVLSSVTMISASEGWAVGENPQSGTALILHYQNGQWQLDAKPLNVYGMLSAVAMVSPDEGWAMGTDGSASLILHYTRAGGWAKVDTPLQVPFNALSMISPSDGWAVGDRNNFVHYADGAWC